MYEVNINANHVGLPSCDCPDWRDNHLPCKHFFAVFNTQTACSWECLPEDYKNNPFINLDIGQFSYSSLSIQPEDATDATEEDSNESRPHETQQINISAIKKQRNLVGSACRQLTDLAYHCQDMDVLRKISTQLQDSLQVLKDNVPNSGLFVLEEGDMLHIGSTKAAKKLKNKYLQKKKLLKLPKRRMKKPATGRRGQTAAMMRNQFTTKGAEELISENHGMFFCGELNCL